jgi:hypothetical protein
LSDNNNLFKLKIFCYCLSTNLVCISHLLLPSLVYQERQIFYLIDQHDLLHEIRVEVGLILPLYNQQTIYQVFHHIVPNWHIFLVHATIWKNNFFIILRIKGEWLTYLVETYPVLRPFDATRAKPKSRIYNKIGECTVTNDLF